MCNMYGHYYNESNGAAAAAPSVLQDIRQAVADHGSGGDGSLECVSLTARGGIFAAPSVYRLYHKDPAQPPIVLPPELAPMAECLPPDCDHLIRISDISRTGDGRWRMCFKFRARTDRARHCAAAAALYRALQCDVVPDPMTTDRLLAAALEPDVGTLVQMGAEVHHGRTVTLKTYYSLRTGTDGERYHRFPAPEVILPVVQSVWRTCGGTDRDLSGYDAAPLTALGYHPFLLGLNQSADGAELKLYHMLSPCPSGCGALRAWADRAMAVMGCSAPELTASLDAMGLYLRGLAYCCTAGTTGWKLYFSEKQER